MRSNRNTATAARWIATLALAAALGGCTRPPLPPEVEAVPSRPTEAVMQLAQDLRDNDLQAYARHALPPALHAQVAAAWRRGDTIWPLSELPLDDRVPGFIAALAAPEAEKTLLAAFNRQFAGADRELRGAASTLGLFAAQYAAGAEEYGDQEREHYVQLVAALSQWGQRAPLADAQRAKQAVPQLVAAARLTGLGKPDAFRSAGMEHSLGRLGPFLARFKQVLLGYGLDLDGALDSIAVDLVEQTGERAQVRLRYTLAGHPVDAIVHLEREDGRWYLSELLRHAREQLQAPDGDVVADAASG